MGTQSIVYGRILLAADKLNSINKYSKTIKYIKTLKKDNSYPFIRTEMFSLGAKERPFFYDNSIITFGATYKSVEYYWTDFIQKFENILRNIEFDTARIKLETEFLGSYDFFWKKKIEGTSFDKKEKLIETDEWFFGYGDRCRWGHLNKKDDNPVFDFEGFKYPIN